MDGPLINLAVIDKENQRGWLWDPRIGSCYSTTAAAETYKERISLEGMAKVSAHVAGKDPRIALLTLVAVANGNGCFGGPDGPHTEEMTLAAWVRGFAIGFLIRDRSLLSCPIQLTEQSVSLYVGRPITAAPDWTGGLERIIKAVELMADTSLSL